MGGASSSNVSDLAAQALQKKTEAEIVAFVMPIYYSKVPLLPHEKEMATKAWKYISTGQAQEFYRLKREDPDNTPCKTPMEFFGNQFYRRLLEVHPTCRGIFTKSTLKQGELLLRMLSFAVSELNEDETKFNKTFHNLANCHNRIGVKACEYGIFGEVLFWALKKTLGPEIYTAAVHGAWIKIYSKMLTVIIPVAVAYEINHKDDYKPIIVKRMTTLVPLSSNVVLAGDETSMSVCARGPSHCPHTHHSMIQHHDTSITSKHEYVREAVHVPEVQSYTQYM